ncbi:MAG: hypothetical protein ABF271_06645, partial [Abyssibacter sp.]|uniref:hypothetical protein n=1 Tax=Abyssibacter sp. TaxID=2320200 RepID=UPI00321B2D30
MPAASVNFLLPFKDLGCVDILQRSAYIASGPAAVTLVAGLVALALGGPAERYLAEAIRGQFAPDLLNLISVVSLGLVGLSGIAPRWRGYRDVGLLIAAGTAGVTFDYLSFAIGVLLGLFPVAVADKGFLWAVATVLPTVAILVAFQWMLWGGVQLVGGRQDSFIEHKLGVKPDLACFVIAVCCRASKTDHPCALKIDQGRTLTFGASAGWECN